MKRKAMAFLGICLLVSIAVFSCASTDGGNGDELSLEEAIEQSAVEVLAELPNGTRVAIVAFTSEHTNLSNYIMDELTGALVDGSLEVADRRNLEYVYKELNFQMSGNVSDESAVSIGKFLGAKYVIAGQFVKAGDRYRYRLSGINVETAIQESSSRLNVRDDRALQSLLADVRRSPAVTVVANYGEPQTGTAPTAGNYLDRGIYFASQGEYDKAIGDFTEAIRLDGNLASAYRLRGMVLGVSVSHVTKIGENFSEVESIATGGNVTANQKIVFTQAIADYTQALRLDPNNDRAYAGRGWLYSETGDYSRAIDDYNQAIRINPNFWQAYRNRGVLFFDQKNYDRAIADYNQAIRINPNDPGIYSNRGNAYKEKRDFDRAIADQNQAIMLNPNDAISYFNRGSAYANKGDYARARADWTKALQIDPSLMPYIQPWLDQLRQKGY